jgi:hypothetical protein
MKKSISVLLLISIVIFSINSCEDVPPTISYSTPSVKIVSPINNSAVSDTTRIKITVNNIDVKRVELYIDHTISQSTVFEKPPYEYLWDCRWYEEGSQHILQAKAYTKSGKAFESDYVIINVYRFMPSNLIAEIISDSVIVLDWIDNCKYETGFEVEQAVDDSNFFKIAQLDSNSTSYLVNGNFSLNAKYLYRVRAFQNKIFSGYSNIAQAVLRLIEPINLNAAIISDTSAILSWNDNNSFETGYVISKLNNNGTYYPIQYLPANSNSTIVYEIFYLNQNYNYSVHAVKDFYQSPKALFPPIVLAFPAPTELTFEHLSETSIKLKWKDNSSFEKGFIIYGIDNSGYTSEIARVGSNITEYVVQSLDTSEVYIFHVKAFTSANITPPSNNVKIFFSKTLEIDKHFSVPYGISEAAVSDDFTLVAIGGYIGNSVCVRVFNLANGSLIKTFLGDSTDQIFEKIAISPDNKYVAAIGNYYTIKIWDIVSGQLYKRLELGYGPNFIQYTTDGNYLIVERYDHLRFYKTNDWSYTARIIYSGNAVYMSMDPNQNLLALGFWDSNLKVWDFQSGTFKYEIPNTFRSTSIHFNADGDKLYFHSYGDFKVWDVNTNTLNKTITNFGFPRKMDITSDGKLAVYSGNATSLSLWDISKEINIDNFLGNKTISEVKFSPDNDKLFTREFVSGYYLWNIVDRWVRSLP